jgi:hypothetical protein
VVFLRRGIRPTIDLIQLRNRPARAKPYSVA